VVDGLTFALAPGSLTACMGPNGAGKSTLLKLLAGTLAPSEGEARINGMDARRGGAALRRTLGVLPERLGLFGNLTVEEHLLMAGRMFGLGKEETRLRTGQLLRALDLEHGRETFADRCSMGMRKKTALALALIHNPSVLLLDEPFESVDPASARAVHDLLAGLPGRGVTVFFTSHALTLSERIATHFLFLDHGRLVRLAQAGELEASLEETYFDHLPPLSPEDLPWLGSSPS